MAYDVIIGRNEVDKKLFGKKGLAYLGKTYVTMGQHTSLSNPIYLDVARTHVILVSGKRGSGKCLHEDTLITLEDGSQIPIKELENNNQKIISLNNNLKLEKSQKTEFFSRQVKKLLKIRLRSGKEIKLTPEHPLLTIKGWKPAEQLKIGSRIATPRKSFFGEEEMPENEIKLLAYLIAEGHTKNVILFSNTDKKIINEFKKSLKRLDNNLKLKQDNKACFRIVHKNWKKKGIKQNIKRKKKGQFTTNTKNMYIKRKIRELIEEHQLFNKLAIEKELSNKITKLKKPLLSLFINRLFSCDGSIYKKKTKNSEYWEVSYSSSSKKLITQVQSLLLKFNILSKIRKKKIKYKREYKFSFELILNSQNSFKFIQEIGFYGDKKEKQIKALKEREDSKKLTNPNVDTIPKEIWEFYKPSNWARIGRSLNYKHPKAMRERIRYCPSRQTLLQIAKTENNNPLINIATSDIFWDEIISLEILEDNFTVYDLCVPNNHNFIANDIIVHNSYTLGVIAESLCSLDYEEAQNISPLIFDTMGIFWTMKFKNQKDSLLLNQWDLESKNIPVQVFAPFGYFQEFQDKGIPVDKPFALKISEIQADDWINLFELEFTSPTAILIENIISNLKQKSFSFKEIYNEIEKTENTKQETKNSAISLFKAAESWKVFSEEQGTPIRELVSPGQSTIIDLSMYSSMGSFNIRALIIGLVSKKIFNERMAARKYEEIQAVQHGLDYLNYKVKREMPLVWIFIDEAHEFLPLKGKTPASNALVQLLREGRQPGISMVLATQQPGKIHTDAMTQSDIVLSHRVTAAPDIKSLNEIMQSYLYQGIQTKLNQLPKLKGSAIILDDNSERIYPCRIRPRFTWHGGEAPTSVKIDKDSRI